MSNLIVRVIRLPRCSETTPSDIYEVFKSDKYIIVHSPNKAPDRSLMLAILRQLAYHNTSLGPLLPRS